MSAPRRRLAIVAVLAVASVVFVAREVRDGWDEVSGEQIPSIGWVALAVGLLALGQVLSGEAMAVLPAEPTTAAQRRRVFHLTQPAKYIPAGVAQAAGVVVVLQGRGATRSAGLVVWAVHTASVIIAGLAVGLVTAPALGWPPVVVLAGLAVAGVISRPVLNPVFARVGRVASSPLVVPPARALATCLVLALAAIALQGLGFAVLVRGASLDAGVIESVAAYALAFGISVATPLPGGLGAREAIIFALLTSAGSTLFVPVVLVRLLLIGIELVLLVLARLTPGATGPVDPAARDAGAA